MTALTLSDRPAFLSRKIAPGITVAHLLVAGIMLLSLALHLSNLSAIGDANTYYTAAVESMTQSWHNFYFVAAEPGGSVTVDKPPLGLWVEAAFAFVFGVSGVVVSMPNILAGVLSVPLLYSLVKRHMGAPAGLAAALVLVATPVAIATDRNNTMDGMLVFTLLLATWAFIEATETGKARWLYAGAVIVGLGFNIKMLQAFLPLPAFYALYFLGAKTGWGRKTLHVLLSGTILLAVSLSWTVSVDLTPTDQRPYIGSSENNTVMELIVGHNGLSRLFGRGGGNAPQGGVSGSPQAPGLTPNAQGGQPGGATAPPQALAACANLAPGAACSFTQPNGNTINGACIYPPGTDQLACAPAGVAAQNRQPLQPPAGMLGDGPNASPDGPNNANAPFSNETGAPGVARFFIPPLSKQMSWLLPFALASLALAALGGRIHLPLAPEHKFLILWGGWLLTCLAFFSSVEGIFHAYYAIMLAPALGAVTGGGLGLLWRWRARGAWVGALLALAAGITVAFEIFTAAQYGNQAAWVYLSIPLLVAGGGLFFAQSLHRAAYATILAAMLYIPLAWTGLTVFDAAPDVNLPTAFDGGQAGASRPAPALNEANPADRPLVTYLQAHTQDVEYLAAVLNAHTGAPLVLATGRPVLYMGGFGGSDPVIDAAGLAAMVANGELRYVLFGSGNNGKQDIAQWLATACRVVPAFSQGSNRPGANQPGAANAPGGDNQQDVLYQCGG